MAKDPRPLRIRKDGEVDLRGHSEGSKATQFARDDSRHRPGRRKGSRDEKSQVEYIRDLPVKITIGGRERKVPTRTAIFLKMREQALKGDRRAAEFLERKFAQYEPPSVERDLTIELLAEDQEILRLAAERYGGAISGAVSSELLVTIDELGVGGPEPRGEVE